MNYTHLHSPVHHTTIFGSGVNVSPGTHQYSCSTYINQSIVNFCLDLIRTIANLCQGINFTHLRLPERDDSPLLGQVQDR